MKKLLTLAIAFFIVVGIINAKTIDINDIDTNTYIIGYRVFELNNYDISIYDVSQAIAEYVSINNLDVNEIKELPIYYYSKNKNGVKKIEKITGSINGNLKVPVKVFSNINDVFQNGKLEVIYLNNSNTLDNLSDKERISNLKNSINELITKIIKELNNQDGYNNVKYSGNTISLEITDKLSAALNGAAVLSNIIKEYKNTLDNNIRVSYQIKLPDNELMNGTIDNNLNSSIKLLRNIVKKIDEKNNKLEFKLIINSNKEQDIINYNVLLTKKY